MTQLTTYRAGLYCRLSKDDETLGESVSIGTQRAILTDFCLEHGFSVVEVYVDDGYSGLNFDRPGFQRLLEDVITQKINMVITKDLSRLGRDYIMTGYYSEIFFQSKGVRYIAVADDVDSLKGNNEIAPFKNILNDMYARDISKKVKNAKRQRAKQGAFIGSHAPFGYQKDPDNKGQLIIDPEAAEIVRHIFSLADSGLGNVAIAKQLQQEKCLTPSFYKFLKGDFRFSNYSTVRNKTPYVWSASTIGKILTDRVYIGELTALKTETINCKTKQRNPTPAERRIVTINAHKPIVSQELFNNIQVLRSQRRCPAYAQRDNIFRGILFCECCGHPLTISRKKLLHRNADIYFCAYHYRNREVCPKTHRVYHEMLYPYVLQQIQNFAKSMKRRKVNSPIKEYASIEELTPEVLDNVIERIEIGHVTRRSKPGNVIQIYWKLK